ncbi:MAG TPA: nicotinate-nucleotide adenylyltransferase [Longimicrobiales bacterium]|nr:nicotinate-nucleotide adenylyltransferase [Longimicrobiales bacterium]
MAPAPDRPSPARIGVFGGTFDPPHLGHVGVATDVADHLRLDRLLWVPAGIPPHKAAHRVTDAAIRLEMVRRAAAGDPRFEVSDLELSRPGPSYTVDTLRRLHAEHPDAELFLLLGADQVETFAGTWKDPADILELARLAVLDRAGERAPAPAGGERAVHVPVRRVDVSSTEVRARASRGEDISDLVPPGVADVVDREGLYRDG